MLITSTSLIQDVQDYLLKAESPSGQRNVQEIADLIFLFLRESSFLERRVMLQQLKIKIPKVKTRQSTHLCRAIEMAFNVNHWKDAILGSYKRDLLKVRHPFISYSNRLDHPLKLPTTLSDRFCRSEAQNAIVYYGSTFITNKANRIDDKGNYLLDAVYATECYDGAGNYTGFALSLADGAGGHFGDDLQDSRIANAAYFASKSYVRFASVYHDAEFLKQDFDSILLMIKDEVNRKACGEATTLLGCRVFLEKESVRLIGFNIGDCMMVAWDPHLQMLHHLLPSQVSEAGIAMFPVAYHNFEIQLCDESLPLGSMLFLLSDGVHDSLAYTEVEKTYQNGLEYRSRYLDSLEILFREIPRDASIDTYLQAILKEGIQHLEAARQQKFKEENIQMGDDVTLLGICLNRAGRLSHALSVIKNFFLKNN